MGSWNYFPIKRCEVRYSRGNCSLYAKEYPSFSAVPHLFIKFTPQFGLNTLQQATQHCLQGHGNHYRAHFQAQPLDQFNTCRLWLLLTRRGGPDVIFTGAPKVCGGGQVIRSRAKSFAIWLAFMGRGGRSGGEKEWQWGVSWSANGITWMPSDHIPLWSFIFRVHCRVSLSLHADKGKCCMWHVNKVKICYLKLGHVDSKWSNLNTQGYLIPLMVFNFGVHCRVSLSLHAGKGNAACEMLSKWNSTVEKKVLWTANRPTRMPQLLSPVNACRSREESHKHPMK